MVSKHHFFNTKTLTMKLIIIAFAIGLMPMQSFSQTTGREFTTDGVDTIIKNHKIFAILPFHYKVALKKMPKGMTEADIRASEIKSSLACQNSLYTYALEKKSEKKITIEIQDINRTNALLKKNDINESNYEAQLPEDLCKILSVDAVILGDIVASQPMSNGAAIATTMLIGYGGKTNTAKAKISLYNATDGKLIWSYAKDISGGLGSDDNDLIRILMRKSARKFPYSEGGE
jgi:hypothetical protein